MPRQLRDLPDEDLMRGCADGHAAAFGLLQGVARPHGRHHLAPLGVAP